MATAISSAVAYRGSSFAPLDEEGLKIDGLAPIRSTDRTGGVEKPAFRSWSIRYALGGCSPKRGTYPELAAHSLRIPHPTASVQFCQCVLYCDRRGL